MTDDIQVPARSEAAALVGLADLLADAKLRKEEADEAAKVANEAYEAIEAKLFDAMEDAGLQSVRTERGMFRLNDLAWASVTDEEAARVWAEHNEPALLTLNRQRLSVIVRRTLKGEESAPGLEMGSLPPGVDFRTSRKITWRRQ